MTLSLALRIRLLRRLGIAIALAAIALLPALAADAPVKDRLSAVDQQKHLVVPEGFVAELVASDPLVINPISMAVDGEGRIYVSESHTYRYGPKGSPVEGFSNPIVRLEPAADGKGYQRVVVAEGFEEPVMGLALRGNQLWCTANNFLFVFDIGADGKATNKRTVVTDKNKAWNPFGMFVIEFGPDGQMYLSVGNHNIDLQGANNSATGRGGSGIVVRLGADGSNLERLVHGLRVPYSFEMDPFGQLWVLSNGEGNPNRFVRVIDGVDYHCYSRGAVDGSWLSGKHPLAPPCFELPSGAHTQLMRYYGAAFPAEYQGSLLLDNWGAHGFNGGNRAVFRYVPDKSGEIVKKEMLVSCTDPHFRPSHIALDPDGNLLVADWYGRDDESDLTGRIWRIRYTGKDRPAVTHKLDGAEWNANEYALSALASPSHLVREKAMDVLIARGDAVVDGLAKAAKAAAEPMQAAHALWCLQRIGSDKSKEAIAAGVKHSDERIRRLAISLLRRLRSPLLGSIAAEAIKRDESMAVRVEAALALADPSARAAALVDVLKAGAATDAHLRYQAAWHLSEVVDAGALRTLLSSADAAQRLAGAITIDVACYENRSTADTALAVLAEALGEKKPRDDYDLLLTLVRLNGGKSADLLKVVEQLAMRSDVPPSAAAQALLALRSAGGASPAVIAAAGKHFLEAVERGQIQLTSSKDRVLLIELLAGQGPTDFAVKQLGGFVAANQREVNEPAQALARSFGTKASSLAPAIWPRLRSSATKFEERVEFMATVARIEADPDRKSWSKLLDDIDVNIRAEAIRTWRAFKGKPDMVRVLVERASKLVEEAPELRGDLAAVLSEIAPDEAERLQLQHVVGEKDARASETLTIVKTLKGPERQKAVWQGRQVFDRTGCTKCHTTVTQNTLLAPSLKGIATAQKAEYLVESVLHPSRVIKTGFETEVVVTKEGQSLTGLVREDGADLRIITADKETRLPKTEVENRVSQKVSLMPEGQEKQLSPAELAHLVAYLMSLK